MKFEKICPICQTKYLTELWLIKSGGALTCSRKCGSALTAIKLSKPKKLLNWTCRQCGKAELRQPFRARASYCSRRCSSLSQKIIILVKCARCGKSIERPPWHVNMVQSHFCSKECANPPVIIKCDQCGKEKRISPSAVDKNNFCSEKCFHVWLKNREYVSKNRLITIKCDNCSMDLKRQPNQIKRNSHNFCNMKCFAKWKSVNWTGEDNPVWRGGFEPFYGDNWTRQSRLTRNRDNHECQYCGIKEHKLRRALDVHHIVPLRKFERNIEKANALSNLISLCQTCHKFLEWHRDKMNKFITSWLNSK